MAERRHVLVGDLDVLEGDIARYIERWGRHLDGVHPGSTGGVPTATANMAMTVIRRHIEPAHVPWFARLRARIFGRSKSVVFGRDAH